MGNQQTENFLKLLLPNQKRILAYILSVLPNHWDAEDVMQETTHVMWRKFREFDPSKDFTAWGVGIAYLEVLKYRKKQNRDRQGLRLDALKLLHEESNPTLETMDQRVDAIQRCMRKLKASDFALVQLRYEEDCSVKGIAAQMGKSVQAVYRQMARVNLSLMRCVRQTLFQEGLL